MRYRDDSISPFLLVQDSDHMRQLQLSWRAEPAGAGYSMVHIPSATVAWVATIEAAEDYYLAQARQIDVGDRELSTFCLNAQASIHASSNRRGWGWVCLMHPDMFARIEYFPPQPNHCGPVTQFRAPETPLTIGRWTLAAEEDYRGLRIWTSPHCDPHYLTTVYRNPDADQDHDGIVVGRGADGFALSPIDNPLVSVGEYVARSRRFD